MSRCLAARMILASAVALLSWSCSRLGSVMRAPPPVPGGFGAMTSVQRIAFDQCTETALGTWASSVRRCEKSNAGDECDEFVDSAYVADMRRCAQWALRMRRPSRKTRLGRWGQPQ